MTTSPEERRERIGSALWKRLVLLTALGLPWSFLTLLGPLWWIFENMAEFQLQLLVTGALLGLSWIVPVAFRWIPMKRGAPVLVLIAVAVVIHVAAIWPCWFGRAVGPLPGRKPLKVMAVNVHTANTDYDHVRSLISQEKPHVVILLEIDRKWRDAVKDLEDNYPVHYYQPSDHDNFGIGALCSLRNASIEPKNLSPATPRVADTIHVRLDWEGKRIELIGVHTVPPGSPAYARGNRIQMKILAEYVTKATHPCILAGDLNHTPWSPTFRRLLNGGKLSHGREGRGYISTWPRNIPFLRLPIDHVLVTGELTITDFRRFPAGGSDHNPIQAQIIVDSEAR